MIIIVSYVLYIFIYSPQNTVATLTPISRSFYIEYSLSLAIRDITYIPLPVEQYTCILYLLGPQNVTVDYFPCTRVKESNTFNVRFNVTHVGETTVKAYLRDSEGVVQQIYAISLSFDGGRPSKYRIFGPSISTRIVSNTTSDLCSNVLMVRGYSFMGDPLPLSQYAHSFKVEVWDDVDHTALSINTHIFEIAEEREEGRKDDEKVNECRFGIYFFSRTAMQLGIQFTYPVRNDKYLVRVFQDNTQLYSGPLYCPAQTEFIEVT